VKKKPAKNQTRRVSAKKNLTGHRERRKLPVFNLLLTILVWLAVVTLFYSGRFMRPQKMTLGQTAPETVIASVDFHAETLSATALDKQTAAKQVLPVFRLESSGLKQARQVLGKLLPRLQSLRAASDDGQKRFMESSILDLLSVLSIELTTNELLQILPPNGTELQTIILDELTATIESGITGRTDELSRLKSLSIDDTVVVRDEETESIRNINRFLTQSNALERTTESISRRLPREQRHDGVIRKLIRPWLHPNLQYDAAETAARRIQTTDLVEPVIEPVEAGTILVRSGEQVNEQTLRWLAAHEHRLSELETPAERIQRLAGSGLLLLIGLVLTAAVAGIVRPALLYNRRDTLLLLTVSVLPLVLGKLLLYLSVTLRIIPPPVLNYILPLALAPLLAAVLLGGVPGLLAGLWTGFALSALLGGSFDVFLMGLLVTVTAVYTTRDVKRRTTLFRAGLWIGAVKILIALTLAVLNQPAWSNLLLQLGGALVSGFVYALLVILLIPLFENLFKITTDITLLELSDLSHPLLQSLAMNAPGTYHHSLMMASLAQTAADAIGANGLMLRVCAYFHDIGKLVKPGFFSENIQYTENPHDELSPSMSTLVIVSHIKEGVTLAKKYKLPQVILDGIRQHQGTGLVSVFYHRAKTQQQKENGSGTINDEDFRYEGPRPQTREMAILMLADGCEAASRSLDKPTPVRIANLIGQIFDSRLHDKQLDECNLTLAELNQVKQSFIFTLTNMLHGRVAYPKDEKKKPASDNQNQRTKPADRTPDPS
jgi:cyclic-di-AMP phosphodiesterase PgpH